VGGGAANQNSHGDECSTLAFQSAHPRRARPLVILGPDKLHRWPTRPVQLLRQLRGHGPGAKQDLREVVGARVLGLRFNDLKSAPLRADANLLDDPSKSEYTKPAFEESRAFGSARVPQRTSRRLTPTRRPSGRADHERAAGKPTCPAADYAVRDRAELLAGSGSPARRARSAAYVATPAA